MHKPFLKLLVVLLSCPAILLEMILLTKPEVHAVILTKPSLPSVSYDVIVTDLLKSITGDDIIWDFSISSYNQEKTFVATEFPLLRFSSGLLLAFCLLSPLKDADICQLNLQELPAAGPHPLDTFSGLDETLEQMFEPRPWSLEPILIATDKPALEPDLIQTEYHPSSRLATRIVQLQDFGGSCDSNKTDLTIDPTPWKLYQSLKDFELSEMILESALNKGQIDAMLCNIIERKGEIPQFHNH
ncbi:hypothetical protein F5146DRAFT_1006377 [Armillaria mellea]|nr:hypothetical protein F5146DRAFT_1006377 [Armillaria mellea]